MYQVKSKSLAEGILQLLKLREGRNNLRGLFIFQLRKVRTNIRSRCASVCGVKW